MASAALVWGYRADCGEWVLGHFVRMISETSDAVDGHKGCTGRRPARRTRPRHHHRPSPMRQ